MSDQAKTKIGGSACALIGSWSLTAWAVPDVAKPAIVPAVWDWNGFGNTATAALLGTAVGGLVAFLIENVKRRERLEDEHVMAANVAIFALSRAWRDLESYRTARIEPVRAAMVGRWYQLAPGELNSPPIPFDASTLAFLFETKSSDLPAQVQYLLDRFEAIRREIRNRTLVHVEQVQPKLEATLAGGEQQLEAHVRIAAGPRLYQTLKGMTESIIEEVDTALPEYMATALAVRETVLKLYPKRTIIRFEPIEKPTATLADQ